MDGCGPGCPPSKVVDLPPPTIYIQGAHYFKWNKVAIPRVDYHVAIPRADVRPSFRVQLLSIPMFYHFIIHNQLEHGLSQARTNISPSEEPDSPLLDSSQEWACLCTFEGKSKWHHQVFQNSFHLKR